MSFEEMLSSFEKMPNISIDYAVMERSERVVTQPLDLYWNDIGSWDSLAEAFPKDEKGNIKIGDVIDLESSNTIIIGNKRLIATI